MIGHERSLVEHYQGKPVVLLGVNSDADRDMIAGVMAQEGITWRSWWDGGSANGPIAHLYKVVAWPTIYVLDGRGTIRFANVNGPALDQAVETLLHEME
jgi:hypothetical protein